MTQNNSNLSKIYIKYVTNISHKIGKEPMKQQNYKYNFIIIRLIKLQISYNYPFITSSKNSLLNLLLYIHIAIKNFKFHSKIVLNNILMIHKFIYIFKHFH